MKLNKMREEMANSFLNALKEDTIPWHKGWSSMKSRPYNAINQSSYHGINSFWLSYVQMDKGYQDPRWCTFKQAKDKGWNVKKGEKGTKVEFWSMYDTETKNKLNTKQVKELKEVLGDNDFYERVKPISSVYTVFNGEQIDGIPELTIEKHELDENTLLEKRDVLLENMQVGFEEGQERAFYRPSEDRICMPDIERFEDEYAYMSTFLHEAGHATGHESRLDRNIKNTFGSPDYAKEELRAEIASAFTAQVLSLPGSEFDNHKAYVQNWIEVLEKNPEELFAAIKDAEKISDYLIEKGEFLEEKTMEKTNSDIEILGYYTREDGNQYIHYQNNGQEYLTSGIVTWNQKEQLERFLPQLQQVDNLPNMLRMGKLLRDYEPYGDLTEYLQENVPLLNPDEIYQQMTPEEKEAFDITVDYGDIEGADRIMETKRHELLQEQDITMDIKLLQDVAEMEEKLEMPQEERLTRLNEQTQIYEKKRGVAEEALQKRMNEFQLYEMPLLSFPDAAKVRLMTKGREVDMVPDPIHIQVAEQINQYQKQGMSVPDILSNRVEDMASQLEIEDVRYVKNLICSVAAQNREQYEQLQSCIDKNAMDKLVAVGTKLAARLQQEGYDIVSQNEAGELIHHWNPASILSEEESNFYTPKKPFERMIREADKTSIPVIQCEWSESFTFDEGKYYSVSEFDQMMQKADETRVSEKQKLLEKYGSEEELYESGSMEEVALGAGYDKVKFVIYTKGDQKVDRQDIGDGDGGVVSHIQEWDKNNRFVPTLEQEIQQEQDLGMEWQRDMVKENEFSVFPQNNPNHQMTKQPGMRGKNFER